MDPILEHWTTVAAGAGVVFGLFILARGLAEQGSHARVADTMTSTISSIAVGEVRISGIVEPAALTVVSLLQSRPCVYFRSAIEREGGDGSTGADYVEERSTGFYVRDATGRLRVFPRGARFDAPERFVATTGWSGDEPPGLDMRHGSAFAASRPDRDTAIADLLSVRRGHERSALESIDGRSRRRSYRERRLEPGDQVTIVGLALPFSQLADPSGADHGGGSASLLDDPVVATDLASARAAGTLLDDPREAWGNAAIPGFGIGRPATAPVLHPGVTQAPLADASVASDADQTFDIAPDALVLADSDDVPLLIAFGSPGAVVQRGRRRLETGLLGAVMAIVSAMALALSLGSS